MNERSSVDGRHGPEGIPVEEASVGLRVGHLLRIDGYLEYAILSMWRETRADVVIGMVEASVRGTGPGGESGPDEELLAQLRALIPEARRYLAVGDGPAAMARMRVAEDLVALRVVSISCGP